MVKYFSLRFTLFLLCLDAALVILALWGATFLRIILPFGLHGSVEQRFLGWPIFAIGIVVHQIVYSFLEVHNPKEVSHLAKELRINIVAALFGWMIFLGALYLTYRDTSRLQIVYFFIVHLVLIVLSRIGLRFAYWIRGRRRMSQRKVIIIGTGDLAYQMHNAVKTYEWAGLLPLGLIALHEGAANAPLVIGQLDALETLISACEIREVVIAIERDTPADLPTLIQRLQTLAVNIRIVPQYTDLAFLRVQIEDFGGMPLLTLKEPILTPMQRLTKRLFDVTVSLLVLLLASPIMAVIAALIRWDSPGRILFKQQRIGENGKPFTMYKFRTMIDGAEWLQETVARYDEHGRLIYKHPDDPRITHVGQWLRNLSLDELPQLFNVLRGEMSLVGPRPELPERVAEYATWQRKRFEVPQGMTGWWQISGRADKPMYFATEDDLYYIRNYSIWMDIRILWRTLWVVLSRRGAY